MGASQSGTNHVNLHDVKNKLETFNNLLQQSSTSNEVNVDAFLDNLLQSNSKILGLQENAVLGIKKHHGELKQILQDTDTHNFQHIENNIPNDNLRNEVVQLVGHVKKLHNGSIHFEKKYIELNIIVLFIIKQIFLISQTGFESIFSLMDKQNVALGTLINELHKVFPEIEDKMPNVIELIKHIQNMSTQIKYKVDAAEKNLKMSVASINENDFSSPVFEPTPSPSPSYPSPSYPSSSYPSSSPFMMPSSYPQSSSLKYELPKQSAGFPRDHSRFPQQSAGFIRDGSQFQPIQFQNLDNLSLK